MVTEKAVGGGWHIIITGVLIHSVGSEVDHVSTQRTQSQVDDIRCLCPPTDSSELCQGGVEICGNPSSRCSSYRRHGLCT